MAGDKTRSQDLNPGFPYWWQGPSHVSSQGVYQGMALAGRSWEPELGIKPKHSSMGPGHPNY